MSLAISFAPMAAAQLTASPHVTTFVVDGLGKGSVPLDGPWQFHLGDDPSFAQPSLDDTTGHNGWEQITADKAWGPQGHRNYTGYAWYRRHVSIRLAPGAAPDVALYLPWIRDVCGIYWNGVLVGGVGQFPPHPKWDWVAPSKTFGLGPVRDGVVAFRFWKSPAFSGDSGYGGGFTGPPIVGSPAAIASLKASWNYDQLHGIQVYDWLLTLQVLVALIGLIAWLRDRRRRLLFWIGCFAASYALPVLAGRAFSGSPFLVAEALNQPGYGLSLAATCYVLTILLLLGGDRWVSRLVGRVAVFALVITSLGGLNLILFSVFTTATSMLVLQWLDAICAVGYTLSSLLPLFLIGLAIARRRRLSLDRWFVAIAVFFAQGIPNLISAVDQGSRFTNLTISSTITAPLFFINGDGVNSQLLANYALIFFLVYAAYRRNQEERRDQARLQQELHNAQELQQVLIPQDIPDIPSFTLTTAYKPAQEVGGDFFQIIPLEDGATLVVLGDVSGKGLKAAMTVALLVGCIRMAAEQYTSPSAVLSALNRRLYGRMQGGFAPCIALRLEPDRNCQLASAGHTSPFLDGTEVLLPGAFPLGLIPDGDYEQIDVLVPVGAQLSLYTDGLLEARSASGELYGFERLNILFGTRPKAYEAAAAAVTFGQDDDITVLTLTRAKVGGSAGARHTGIILSPA